MKIIIKTTSLKLTPRFRDYIQEKLSSLAKFAKNFQDEKYYNGFYTKGKPKAELWLEVGRTTLHHRKGPVFRVEAQMRLPDKSLRAEATSKDLKLAINEVKDSLQRELKKYKGKQWAITERKERSLKKEIHLSPSARFYRRGRIREEGI